MRRTNWTKKITILLATVCVALVAASAFTPALAQAWLLQVEGVPVSRATYCYFLSEALRGTQGKPKDLLALRRDVMARCVEYVAINSELRAMGVPVDQELKAQAADRTAFYWQVYGGYYSSIGVDKQTLNAILTGQAAREQLFRALYDAQGTRAAPEEALEAYFYGNYVAYNGVRVFRTVPLDDETEREMTQEEAAALYRVLAEFVEAANEVQDFFGVAQEERFAEALSYGMPSITVVQKGHAAGAGEDMSADDFEKVRGLAPEKISLLDLPGFYLVAMGVNMWDSPEEYYEGYRAECLLALKGEEYAGTLRELCKGFRADENVGAVEKLYKEWEW